MPLKIKQGGTTIIIQKGKLPNIYCDMDGVLSDFDKQVKLMKLERGSFMNDDFWDSVVEQNFQFWSTMPVMPGTRKLWSIIEPFNPQILSAPLDWKGEDAHKDCVNAKRYWIKRNISSIASKNAIIDSNKTSYLKPGDILIDDMKKNINSWQQAGGIGVLHKNFTQTISELQTILRIK